MNKTQLKQAYERGLITEDKYKEELFNLAIKPKKKLQKRIYEAVSKEDFLKLMKVTKKLNHRIAFILAYGCGLRVSEINELKPENIDFKSRKIMIRQAKGKKDRVTFLSKYFKQRYIDYLPIRIKVRSLSKAFLEKSKKAGFNSIIYIDDANRPRYRYHFHSLRHSFTVNSLKKGVPINVVQQMLGHENLATTSKYAKVSADDAIDSFIEQGL